MWRCISWLDCGFRPPPPFSSQALRLSGVMHCHHRPSLSCPLFFLLLLLPLFHPPQPIFLSLPRSLCIRLLFIIPCSESHRPSNLLLPYFPTLVS
ncbi:hypothetical protein P168DRAFT_122894 [Aspergillus campestris IBT 28561]|uniref:Uncharacterized protein n=1 Tax=Aspergillus campestris (strain IBT 28561) TaxID=1392248 RepID=A0A2I1D6B0_ASPC2|nr:uncharacterized protein P168DRAFT_122894 [Aspergillus campestris IBT 28561]PKY05399.1 hypothetical protein P168DRAFT_122894 [Aspergillus campestris IBT 28561]